MSYTNHYRLPCRVRNWNADLYLEELKSYFATYQKERCQLLVQKVRKIYSNLLRPVQLSHCLRELRQGENYQIIAPYTQDKHARARPLYLAGVVAESDIETCQELKEGSLVFASQDGRPLVRSTFQIVGCRVAEEGRVVDYGEEIFLKILQTGSTPLYVRCENSLQELGAKLVVRLSTYADVYCRFKILYFDPRWRFEHEGTTVPANTPLVIQHVPTGRNLAVENVVPTLTYFGMEFAVTCHNYKDTHKMETAENIWRFGGEDLPDIYGIVQAAKGEQGSGAEEGKN